MTLRRRSFLSRLGLGITAAVTAPLEGAARSIKSSMEKFNPIISVKAMGFQWETADPFLFCVHHEDDFPKGNASMGPEPSYLKGRSIGDDFIIKDGFRMYHGKTVPGFPGHPHRGFETITVVRRGMVDHADSLGAAGRYGNGDVQWMTAGGGVQHSEMFPLLSQEKENPLELFQIWLNLPAKSKMVKPHFKMLWNEDLPKVKVTNNSKTSTVEVIAGSFGGKRPPTPPPDSWAADPKNEVVVLNILMDAGATLSIPATSAGVNRTLYFYEGDKLIVAGQSIDRYKAIQVRPEAEISLQAGTKPAQILMLQGRPIGEPVMQYGPFVMNTKQEIQQAFDDYNRTRFGGWPWPSYDQVHDRKKGRFAKHADGREEVKG